MTERELFNRYLREAGLDFCGCECAEKFVVYLGLLEQWNTKFNLTALAGGRDIIIRHFVDSLMLVKAYNSIENLTIADIGSGAGFPGVPAAISTASAKVTLFESNSKKISFLNHIKNILSLDNLDVVEARSEEISRAKNYREHFDVVAMRALAAYPVAMEISAVMAKKGGSLAYFASSKQMEEIKNDSMWLNELGCSPDGFFNYDLPENSGNFYIVKAKKNSSTPAKYPRLYSMIKKKPLHGSPAK
jgi:16S rRNA (guanine527-N7)-methyltransferase